MSVSRLYAVSGFLPPLDRRSSRDAVAITVSVVFHVAAGLALLHYGFLVIDAPAEQPDVVIHTQMTRYVPPPPPKTPPPPSNTEVSVRTPMPTPFTPPTVLDVVPNDLPSAPNQGTVSLPETPPAPPSVAKTPDPPAPPAAPPRPTVVTSPRWLRQPNGSQMQSAYPSRAAEAGIGGRATINCMIVVGGGVTDCQVVSQSPSGEGFGPAAIQLSRYFLLDPRTENGQAVDGARVTIPLNFQPPPG